MHPLMTMPFGDLAHLTFVLCEVLVTLPEIQLRGKLA